MPESLETLKICSNLSLVTVTDITITQKEKNFTLILPKIKLMVKNHPFSTFCICYFPFKESYKIGSTMPSSS